jgi:hypothetical protein
MRVGFDTTTSLDFLAYRAGDNSVHVIERVAGLPVYGTSGAFAIDLEAGNQNEIFVRESSNHISIVNINAATPAGVTFNARTDTAAFALEMSVGRGNPSGNDILAFRAGDNSVHFIGFTPGAVPTVNYVATNAFAVQVVAGSNEIFTRDLNNRVVYFNIDSGGTLVTQVMTSAFAIRSRSRHSLLPPRRSISSPSSTAAAAFTSPSTMAAGMRSRPSLTPALLSTILKASQSSLETPLPLVTSEPWALLLLFEALYCGRDDTLACRQLQRQISYCAILSLSFRSARPRISPVPGVRGKRDRAWSRQ